jgi:hypothetical protein
VTFQNSGPPIIEIPWRVQPDDQTSSIVEIWLPHGPPAGRLQVTVIAPDGAANTPLGEIPGKEKIGTALGEISYAYSAAGRGWFRISIEPTARIDGVGFVAPSGLWTIRLHNVGLQSGAVIHAFVARDQAPYGYPARGRQSYFDDPLYKRYDDAGRPIEVDNASIVKRAGSMNGMATGVKPVVIGGVLRKELRAAQYSAGGPISPKGGVLLAHREGPDALAVSDDSVVHAGVLAAGTRSGSVVAMNGTSVAAPMITRWLAAELAAGNPGDVTALAAYSEPRPFPAPGQPPAKRGGSGRITLPPVYPLPRYEK